MPSKTPCFLIVFGAIVLNLAISAPSQAVPVKQAQRSLGGVPAQVITIDLSDPHTHLDMLLANKAPRANSSQEQFGDEAFGSMVQRSKAATVINGTFFSKDAQKRVMGNMVRAGVFVKYSRWENFGTSFGLDAGNHPDMFTIRGGDTPRWEKHWFSLTAGPRLLKDGAPWISPATEGFKDPHVLNTASRVALGHSRDGKTLFLVSFLSALSLQQEAKAMKALGAWQAMNLDGGASKSLAFRSKVLMAPSRRLTNAIAVYDSAAPAPSAIKSSRLSFKMALLPNGEPILLSPDIPRPQPSSPPRVPTTESSSAPLPPSPTPRPTPEPLPTNVMAHPQAMAALAAPKYFFWYMHVMDYPKAWAMLTEHSRQTIVSEIHASMNSSDISAASIRQALDQHDQSFAPAFWDTFRHSIDSEKWIKSYYVLDRVDDAEGLVITRPHHIPLKVFQVQNKWRFGFAESFTAAAGL